MKPCRASARNTTAIRLAFEKETTAKPHVPKHCEADEILQNAHHAEGGEIKNKKWTCLASEAKQRLLARTENVPALVT